MVLGHSAWIRSVMLAYEAKLLRYAGDIVGASLARDVVQDTFFKLCRAPREEVEPYLGPWLFTVCRNGSLELRRKVVRLTALEQPVVDSVDSGRATPAAALEQAQTLERVRRGLKTLPERQREVVRLKFDGELSYKEIAEVTGLSVTNVGFILHTALSRVREQLDREDQSAATLAARRAR